jgi:hypothetical protein
MMRRVSRFHWSLVVLLAACERPPQRVQDPGLPDMRLEQVQIRAWSDDRLTTVTTASRLDVYRELGTPGDVVASDAGVTLVSNGTKLRAPRVTGNLFAGQFVGQGGVTMETPTGVRAATPTVAFDRAAGNGGLAWSDAGVVLVQPGLRLEAEAFTYDVGDEHATFEKAKTVFTPRN